MEHDGRVTPDPAGPRGPMPPWERPALPAPVSPDPYLAATVAVLNLSGLGLGYALLRRWVATAVCVVATGGMLAVLLPVDPDGPPGIVLAGYLAFVGLTVIHGVVRGLESARPPLARAPVGLVASIAILAVPVAGVAWYAETAQRMLLDRLAGADRLVQAAKDKPFATVKTDLHRALRTYAYIAREHPGSRAADRLPDRLRTYYLTVGEPYAKKRYCDAIAPLRDLRTVPRTVDRDVLGTLATWPDDRLATSLLECGAGKLGTDPSVTSRGGNLYELLTAFAGSAAARKVEPAVRAADDRLAKRLSGTDPCPAVDQLDVLDTQVAALTGDKRTRTDALDEDHDSIAGHVRSGTYACGVDQYRDGHFGAARETMDDFVSRYGDDKRAALARKIAIAAEIAAKVPAAGRHLPTTASGGSVKVTFLNDSPYRKRILYTGKVTGSLTLSACDHCYVYPSASAAQSFACSGRRYPGTTVHLPAGTVYMLQQSLGTSSFKPYAGSLRLSSGSVNTLCLYTTGHY